MGSQVHVWMTEQLLWQLDPGDEGCADADPDLQEGRVIVKSVF